MKTETVTHSLLANDTHFFGDQLPRHSILCLLIGETANPATTECGLPQQSAVAMGPDHKDPQRTVKAVFKRV